MPELRWILLGAGVLLVAGLWWWETHRRDRDAAEPPAEDPAEEDGTVPQPVIDESQDGSSSLPPIRASRRELRAPPRDLPVVDIPAGVEPELARGRHQRVAPGVTYRDMRDRLDDLPEDLKNLPRDEAIEAEQRLPWVRTQPLDRDEVMGTKAEAGSGQADVAAPETGADDPQEKAASRQRIVALRLIAHSDRWPGRELVAALEAEGLTYGKYSIYHRARDDGKTIFYVASMIEPGSFDVQKIDSLSFPGVSIFAVVPGPIDAPTTFDMMLATARRLTERLNAHLQDEQGSTLTAQRIVNLREELVHFEHVIQRVHRR